MPATAAGLDLSFLSNRPDHEPYLFFERTRHMLDVVSHEWPSTVRRTIADLDLTYYVPCQVRGRTIAFLGCSRTVKGDFLSSEDVELLSTLSGYVGIAVENARLYNSLQRKVEEYERLKEFSENIVESINVGILAADLEDRVESWNTQIERLTGVARDRAIGRRLSELFPPELSERFEEVRGQTGIHNIYKFVLKPAVAGLEHGHAAHPARETILNLAIAPLVSKEYRQIGRLIIFDDVTDRAEFETPPDAGGQAQLHRVAGGRRRSRSEHASRCDLDLRADAGEAGLRRRAESHRCWKRSPGRRSARARSSIRF